MPVRPCRRKGCLSLLLLLILLGLTYVLISNKQLGGRIIYSQETEKITRVDPTRNITSPVPIAQAAHAIHRSNRSSQDVQSTKAAVILGDVTKYCNETPPNLVGRLYFNLTTENITYFDPKLRPGGLWYPDDCEPRHRVAFIIPYRDRYQHLQVMLYHLVPVLQRQQLYFQLFVVEQQGKKLFNKGRIMNAAVNEAEKENKGFQCYVFYDVDMIPENDRNMYSCYNRPVHMSSAINKFGYKLSYEGAAGGVLNLNRTIYMSVNGYTNLLWGWGSEDDDMYHRLKAKQFKLWRPPYELGRYSMFKHGRRANADFNWRQTMWKTAGKRLDVDGFKNVAYNLTQKVSNSSFTYLLVDIGNPPAKMPNITVILNSKHSPNGTA